MPLPNAGAVSTAGKPVRFVVAALVLILSAACGGAEGDAGEQTQAAPTEGEDGAPAAESTSASGGQADCTAFEGETIELVVPFDPGGGFDVFGRLVAPFLEEELGATVIVTNKPGAGGLLATNQTWAAEPDGTLIQVTPTAGMIASELGGAEGVEFETAEFSWIGRITGEPDVLISATDGPIQSVDDIASVGESIRIGSTGIGDIDYVEASLLQTVFDTPMEVVTGYAGAPEVIASLIRGEVALMPVSIGGAASNLEAGDVQAIAIFDDEVSEEAPDAVPLTEVVAEENVPLIEAHAALVASGRALAGPPGMAEDRLECLRSAFDAVAANPEFEATAEEQGRPISPMSGDELEELIAGVTDDAPEEYLQLINESFGN